MNDKCDVCSGPIAIVGGYVDWKLITLDAGIPYHVCYGCYEAVRQIELYGLRSSIMNHDFGDGEHSHPDPR